MLCARKWAVCKSSGALRLVLLHLGLLRLPWACKGSSPWLAEAPALDPPEAPAFGPAKAPTPGPAKAPTLGPAKAPALALSFPKLQPLGLLRLQKHIGPVKAPLRFASLKPLLNFIQENQGFSQAWA